MCETQKEPTATHIVESIDADENEFSDLGSCVDESDYTSISSSIRDHVYENGRRYHSLSAGQYRIPNDENEKERLDMLHHAVGLMLGGALNVVELPEKLDRVLDLGTGRGIWAIDMAESAGNWSRPQPDPANVVDDIEKPWLWKQPFDFIHSANLSQGIHDWPIYTKRIYDNLTPGGVVQLYECELRYRSDDDTIPKGGAIEQYQDLFHEAGKIVKLKDVTDKDLTRYLLDAGFVDVRVVLKKLPIGPWPKDQGKKELGRWGLAIAQEGLKSYGLSLFTRVLGKSTEEATQIIDSAFAELNQSVHAYNGQWFVEGRKPATTEAH